LLELRISNINIFKGNTMKNNKLELTWIGKEKKPKLEPRVLIEDFEKSYYAEQRISEKDIYDNMLIFGDNLLALKALDSKLHGGIKCVYIDPPFNTKQAFEHYDDNLEHSVWLSLMRDRIELIYSLLADDGILFVHLNIEELAYFQVMCDGIFGIDNLVQIITVKSASTASFRSINTCPVTVAEYILMYSKKREKYNRPMQYVPSQYTEDYGTYIINRDQTVDKWKLQSIAEIVYNMQNFSDWKEAKKAWGINWKHIRLLEMADFSLKNANSVVSLNTLQKPSKQIQELIELSFDNRGIVFEYKRDNKDSIYIYNGRTLAFLSSKIREFNGIPQPSEVLTNIWNDISYLSLGHEGGVDFKNGKKPESLIKRILEIATDEGDIVLDSFAGSGTTGAVAHKMGRRWIMVELGEHCHTHIIPRMKKVIDGTDQGGISKDVNWKGGGGFRYYRLAPSLLEKDKWGNWVISKDYNKELLAEAICKLEGFIYAPSETIFWQQGYSTESDYIYVTTQILNEEQIRLISEEVGENRTLLILCLAFTADVSKFNNLTVKKIPKQILNKCEYGKDDYSLNIKNLPFMEQPEKQSSIFEEGEI